MSVRPPPGTVSLLQQHNATDRTHIVLVPHPSSDPNDPLNWSKWRKAFNFTLVLAASLSTFTSIMIQPVLWPDMAVTSNGKLTMTQLQHGQSVNLAGLACGCIFFIPLTIKYGRRLTYILSVATMAGSCWWISQRTTYWEVIVTSWFIGWAGAINETVAQMTIADLFFVHQRATANACYQMSVLLGCFLTPVAAGYQANAEGWRWCYIALGISQTILAIIFVFAYEETKYVRAAPVSFDLNAASSDGKEGSISKDEVDIVHQTVASSVDDRSPTGQPDAQPKTYGQRMRLVTPTDESYWRLFIAPVKVLFLPHVFFTALQYASVICWLVMYSATSPVVFSAPPYNFTAAGLGNMLLGPLVGTMIGGVYGGPISDRLVVRLAKRNGGVFEPEMRLHLLLLTALSMAGGITMYGVTAARGMHWIYPSIGGALYGFGMTALGDISFTLVIDTYYELTAEAFVGVAFLRNALSIGMPSALTPWIAAVGFSNMFIIIGCLCLFIGMLYVPLLIWGKKIRTQLAPRYYHLVENRRFY